VRIKKNKKVVATVGVSHRGVEAALRGQVGSETQNTRETEHSYKMRYFIKGSSNTRVDDDSGRRNGVWWNIKKSNNPDAGDDAGIPPNYLFAVLLTRTNDSTPLEARFRLLAKAGIADKRERVIEIVTRPFTKKRGMGRRSSVHRLSQDLMNFAARDFDHAAKPTIFDPRTKREGDCQDIDRLQLGSKVIYELS